MFPALPTFNVFFFVCCLRVNSRGLTSAADVIACWLMYELGGLLLGCFFVRFISVLSLGVAKADLELNDLWSDL